MALKFCPKCKKILIPKRISKNEFVVRCLKCDYIKKFRDPLVQKSKIEPPKKIGRGVMSDKNIFATYPNKCKKCGYDKAEVLDAGIFYSDEDNLFLLKCGKCGNVERIGKAT